MGRDAVRGGQGDIGNGKGQQQQQRRNCGKYGRRPQNFDRVFQRVIQAGKNITRQIDKMELRKKNTELHARRDETRAKSMEVLGRLTKIRAERLRLTFRTSLANFTSGDAIWYLDKFDDRGGLASNDDDDDDDGGDNDDDDGDDDDDGVTLMQGIMFKHPV